jgi:hypothetical protein
MFVLMIEAGDREQLRAMREVAFRLGMVFGAEAEKAADLDRKLALFDAFHRSFAAVRLSIALDLRLQKPQPAAHAASERESYAEVDAESLEAAEPPERAESFRYTERDREAERASLPALLRNLKGVLAHAEALVPDNPDVPALRAILATARAEAPPSRPAPSRDLRSRLAGSAAPAPPLRPGLRPAPPRRATGPPG